MPTGGRVMLYDDAHFYMGSVIAEVLVARDCTVEFVTCSAIVADWTRNTLEQATIQRRLLEIGVTLHLSKAPLSIGRVGATLACTYTGADGVLPADAVVMVTSGLPRDGFYQAVRALDRQGAGF